MNLSEAHAAIDVVLSALTRAPFPQYSDDDVTRINEMRTAENAERAAATPPKPALPTFVAPKNYAAVTEVDGALVVTLPAGLRAAKTAVLALLASSLVAGVGGIALSVKQDGQVIAHSPT